MGWDVTLPQVLAALAAWTVVSLTAGYYAVARLQAVQAVLALVLRRALLRIAVPEDGGGGSGKPACTSRVRHTSTGGRR